MPTRRCLFIGHIRSVIEHISQQLFYYMIKFAVSESLTLMLINFCPEKVCFCIYCIYSIPHAGS